MRHDHWREYWLDRAKRYGDHTALLAGGANTEIDYATLVARSLELAGALAERNIGPGTRVLTRLPNTPIGVFAHIAMQINGACEIPVAYSATDDELRWVALQSRATVVLANCSPAGLPDSVVVLDPATLDSPIPFHINEPSSDIGHLPGRALPSSGTTGRPKVSVYTHNARVKAHRLQCDLMPIRPGRDKALLLATPFSHGASVLALAWWDKGGVVELHERADMNAIRTSLEDGVSAVFAPPTLLNKILASQDSLPLHADVVFTGTQSLPVTVYQRALAVFGPVMRNTYGKSECINPICYSQPAETDAAYRQADAESGTCVGIAASGVAVQVRSSEGDVLPAGLPGTVWVKADHMSAGVWQEGTLLPWPDGWHDSSDRGYLDTAGRLWLLGRNGDAVKTGGYLVQLEAVEAIVQSAGATGDYCVVALPSEYWGSIIALAVTDPDGMSSEQWDAAFLRHARHMRPRFILQIDAIPRNPQGKAMRAALLHTLLASYVITDGAHPSATAKNS